MNGIFDRQFIDQVRQASDIVDIIGNIVPLKRAGSRFKALSPFKKEKTPSFFVNPDRQIFKCFSSGHGGDVFKFLMLYENLDFPAAVRRLAERAGIPLPEAAGDPTQQKESRQERDLLFEVNAAIAAWWAQLLRNDSQASSARDYLSLRRLDMEIAREFGLGYSPEGWETTRQWAADKGYSDDLLEKAGLLVTNESGRRYDRFRGRLMFPICNDQGRVVGFSGRILTDEKTAKYVNSPETQLFTKGRILFGLDKTKREIAQARSAIICEGQIDLIRCYSKGIRNVVASQGTAFTEHHATLIRRFADEAVICFDADSAGQDAALRSVDLLISSGLSVRIATMPAGEDPDSLLKERETPVLLEILSNAPPYTRHLLDLLCRQNNVQSPTGRSITLREMASMINKIPSPAERHRVSLETSTRLQIPLATFQEELRRLHKPSPPSTAVPYEKEEVSETSPDPVQIHPHAAVEHLLRLLLQDPSLTPRLQRSLNPRWLEGVEGGDLLLRFIEGHSQEEWQEISDFLENCLPQEVNYLTGLLCLESPENHPAQKIQKADENPSAHPVHNEKASPEDYIIELVKSLKRLWTVRRIAIVEQSIKSNLMEKSELPNFLKELVDLKRSL